MTDEKTVSKLKAQLKIAREALERIARAPSRGPGAIPGGRYDRVAQSALDRIDAT